ncbi:hypothetical protein QTV43_000026 [Vibrio vulnificus]|nr:hypothetical protein [Vibrio vulnificus]
MLQPIELKRILSRATSAQVNSEEPAAFSVTDSYHSYIKRLCGESAFSEPVHLLDTNRVTGLIVGEYSFLLGQLLDATQGTNPNSLKINCLGEEYTLKFS